MTGSQGGKGWEMNGPIRLNQVRKGGQMVVLKNPATWEQGSPPEQGEVAQLGWGGPRPKVLRQHGVPPPICLR